MPTLNEAQSKLEEMQKAAMARGIVLEEKEVVNKGVVVTQHWMFNEQRKNRRLLNWWPTNGKWYDQETGDKGEELDFYAVLDMAETIMNERYADDDWL
jgi:hypothetical protein